ncbi:MAG: hypothetical protein R3Y54_12610 [Eubacteriales bacterium]
MSSAIILGKAGKEGIEEVADRGKLQINPLGEEVQSVRDVLSADTTLADELWFQMQSAFYEATLPNGNKLYS